MSSELAYTVVVADDHPIFRKGLMETVREIPGVQIVAEAGDGLEAYQKILSKQPSLAILDIEMPHLTGLDVSQKVLAQKTQTRFILLTMHKDRSFYEDAMKIGVKGYVLKDNAIEDIVACIREVQLGNSYCSPGLETVLIQSEKRQTLPDAVQLLTATEKMVLKLISQEKTSVEIASLLFISSNTVDNHRANIIRKLSLEGKNALLKYALEYRAAF